VTETRSINKRIGSIEQVGKDGFIVKAWDDPDEPFYGGKRIIRDFKELVAFLGKIFVIDGYRAGKSLDELLDETSLSTASETSSSTPYVAENISKVPKESSIEAVTDEWGYRIRKEGAV